MANGHGDGENVTTVCTKYIFTEVKN